MTDALRAWLSSDPAWKRRSATERALLSLSSRLVSWNARQSARLLESRALPTIADPILVIGPWRSGTTLLHELLVSGLSLVTPKTWQTMNAAGFLLTGRPSTNRIEARPMDGLDVATLSPQEDEFALLTLGVPSAYRAFLAPHRIGELHAALEPETWSADSAWIEPWLGFLLGVIATSPGQQPLILKSPNHTFRLPAILARFPRARVVWAMRDPGEVFASNRVLWKLMGELYGGAAPPPADLDAFISVALHRSADIFAWCRANLPASQFAPVALAELQKDAPGAITAAVRRLGLGVPFHADAVCATARSLSIERRRNSREVALPAEARAAVVRLRDAYATEGGPAAKRLRKSW